MAWVTRNRKGSRASLVLDSIRAVFTNNTSILDFFYFKFFDKEKSERASYAGTGFMYEYQLKMNPPRSRPILENKIKFIEAYGKFIKRAVYTLTQMEENPSLGDYILNSNVGKVVLKGSMGQVGAEVKVVSTKGLNADKLLNLMKDGGFDMVEEFVIQHESLRSLSNSGLNTLRLISQINSEGNVEWLGARLRITINSEVDNMAAGNIAAPVDIVSGKVIGPGVYSDITKSPLTVHPLSNLPIVGFQVPHWEQVLTMVEEAALLHPQNRSIGWDVAIWDNGTELIEGNHNWCKLLWQLPVRKGLKSELERFL